MKSRGTNDQGLWFLRWPVYATVGALCLCFSLFFLLRPRGVNQAASDQVVLIAIFAVLGIALLIAAALRKKRDTASR